MKTTRFLLAITAFIAAISTTTAQDYTFKVLVNKGNNQLKTASGWAPLKTGSTLQPTDEIKVAENAYVGLVHSSGKPLEVKKAGPYVVANLAKEMKPGQSLAVKYADFVLSANTEKNNRLSATGSVHRGGKTIQVALPGAQDSGKVFGDSIFLNWNKDAGPYEVMIKNLFGEELKKFVVKDTFLTVNLLDASLAADQKILVEVYPEKNPERKQDPSYMVSKLTGAEKAKLKEKIVSEVGAVSRRSAMDLLILGGFFESNKMLIDAQRAYAEACRLAPDVADFKANYADFLIRSGLIKPEPK